MTVEEMKGPQDEVKEFLVPRYLVVEALGSMSNELHAFKVDHGTGAFENSPEHFNHLVKTYTKLLETLEAADKRFERKKE